MSERTKREAAAAPTVVVTWWGAALALGIVAISLAGDVLMPDWLGLDLDCIDGHQRRRSAAVEVVLCSAAAGPKGWLYLGWFTAPLDCSRSG